jgi:hypothetical protein
MNGNRKTIWILAAAALAGAAYWLYRESASSGSDTSGDTSGDPSVGSSSGAAPGIFTGALEGIASYLAAAGQSIGVAVTKGLRNHNPGNLRFVASIPWKGQVGDDGTGYAVFDTDEDGVRALGHQLMTYAGRGLNTVYAIISTYAPDGENDTQAYITDVSQRLRVSAVDTIDVYGRLAELAAAIIQHENGAQPFSDAELNAWVYEP